MLGSMRFVALSITSHELTQLGPEVFKLCNFFLFLKDPFVQILWI